MTWTDIPDVDLEPGKPVTNPLLTSLRDNTDFVHDNAGRIVYFTASDTYTKPADIVRIRVTVIGGGGGGGSDGVGARYPGAGGGASIKTIPAVDILATETVTIGAAGTGSTGGDGGAGGTSSFGAHASSTGGGGGGGSVPAPGVGSGGDINLPGGAPFPVTPIVDYRGGASYIAPGGYGTGAAPSTATQYGAGGAASVSAAATEAGGAGLVIVEEFF